MHRPKQYEATTAKDYKWLKLHCEAFREGEAIPEKYTCDGTDINPEIQISGLPEEAVSLAIIVDDPDAPGGSFCHWLTWNIPATHLIRERENRGVHGANDFHRHQYNGPCPPSGVHRYTFTIYALDGSLNIPANASREDLEVAMAGHILGLGILQGTYGRKR